MDDIARRAGADGVVIERLPRQAIHILRLRRADEATLEAIGACLGTPLDGPPNTSRGSARRIAWLGPETWMIVGPMPPSIATVVASRGIAHHISDLSDGIVTFRIQGPRARDLLAKGCTIDVHPRSLHPGQCVQTAFAQTRVLIDLIADEPVFHVHADANYATHLATWFDDAIVEFHA